MAEKAKKLDWTLLPFDALKEAVKVMEFGLAKHNERDGWKKYDKHEYIKAIERHWTDYLLESPVDSESKLNHMAHIVCDALFVLWFDIKGK